MTTDTDALVRKLRYMGQSPGFVEVWNEDSDLLRVEYVEKGDYYAATRRAIVRAAAEIGRAMK